VKRSIVRLIAGCAIACCLLDASAACRAGASPPPPSTVLRDVTAGWDVGDRIRLTAPEPYYVQWTGWFASVESDSILRMTLERGQPPAAVRLSQIETIEESVGKKRHLLAGALIGSALGLLVGVIVEASKPEPKDLAFPGLGNFQVDTRPVYPAIGLISGFVVGGAIGYTITTDRWQVVATF